MLSLWWHHVGAIFNFTLRESFFTIKRGEPSVIWQARYTIITLWPHSTLLVWHHSCMPHRWQNELARLLNTHQFMPKLIPNSPILWNNHELRSIVVNKGRIHGEIRKLWEVFWNSIKSDNESWWETRKINIFGKKTWRLIHRIKNHRIWIKIREEIVDWMR